MVLKREENFLKKTEMFFTKEELIQSQLSLMLEL